MLPAEVNDHQLIQEIKSKQDSASLLELVNRHTGIYVNIVNQYTYVPKIERDELLEHKMYNIYNYAMNYNPDRKMKFSSWIGQNIRWQCQRLLHDNEGIIQVEDSGLENLSDKETCNDKQLIDYIQSEFHNIDDKRFQEIFELRHCSLKKTTWPEIAKLYNITKQGARMIYIRNLKKIEEKIHNEI